MWRPIAEKARDITPQKDGLFNLLNWILGCALIYLALFGVGHLIFGRWILGGLFLAMAVLAFVWIYRNLSVKGWQTLSR